MYYEAKAKRRNSLDENSRGGVYNDGYDDQHYDYIVVPEEVVKERYVLKHKIGKVSLCSFLGSGTILTALLVVVSRDRLGK